MSYQLRCANISVGASVANSTTETTFSDVWPLPVNVDGSNNIGRLYTLKGWLYLSCIAGSPGNLTLRPKWGSVSLGAAVIALPTAGLTNAAVKFEAEVMVASTSTSSGKLACQGLVLLDAAGVPMSAGIVNAGVGAAGQITAATSGAVSLGVSAQFSVANAGNAITLSQMRISEFP